MLPQSLKSVAIETSASKITDKTSASKFIVKFWEPLSSCVDLQQYHISADKCLRISRQYPA